LTHALAPCVPRASLSLILGRFPLELPRTARASILRAVLGNAGLIGLFEGLSRATPREPLAAYTGVRFLKYMMVPVYILLLAPPAFTSAGL
jgi:hypothetical protein